MGFEVEGEFAHLFSNQTLPNCVVLGDAGNAFSFEALNKAFRAIKTMPSPRLFALGCGKYYRHKGELHLDVGPFMSALEYATGVQAEVIGKPAKEFFKAALSDLEVNAEEITVDLDLTQKSPRCSNVPKAGEWTLNFKPRNLSS
ncbi:Phospholysine phosphohistidine inorganic pyrophosphate phosphatase [Portunus trituberculatus]|uniref:Phospholysine phosphohistidine inorganic pyrophosphate phosphatase n=1 Tax=Portunus trituberculatus TaxID=210409 RepID=A0A5B7G7A5_PORTR|nr:Phospholysine phosphohistidine inorganic pyrophosphate phosphatase [Portunus trituberculatus]